MNRRASMDCSAVLWSLCKSYFVLPSHRQREGERETASERDIFMSYLRNFDGRLHHRYSKTIKYIPIKKIVKHEIVCDQNRMIQKTSTIRQTNKKTVESRKNAHTLLCELIESQIMRNAKTCLVSLCLHSPNNFINGISNAQSKFNTRMREQFILCRAISIDFLLLSMLMPPPQLRDAK